MLLEIGNIPSILGREPLTSHLDFEAMRLRLLGVAAGLDATPTEKQ